MEAGQLRHRVTIQTATETANGFGELVRSWATYATVWAAVEPLSGREYLQGRQVQGSVTTKIRIRERSGVTERMRVSWGSHTYDIEAVLRDPTNAREIVLMCSEVVS